MRLARHGLDQLLELQRRGELAPGRVQDLQIMDALLELLARARQPREHEVDQQIRDGQQQEAERLIRIVEQDEHDADRHQRRLRGDRGHRLIVHVRPPGAAEQHEPRALDRVVRDEQRARDAHDAQRHLDRVHVRADLGVRAEHPAPQHEQRAAHAAEVEDVRELRAIRARLDLAAAMAHEQTHRGIEREGHRHEAPRRDRAHAQRCGHVVGGVERQHRVVHEPERERARGQDHEHEQCDREDARHGHRHHAQQRQRDDAGPPDHAQRDGETLTGRSRHRA